MTIEHFEPGTEKTALLNVSAAAEKYFARQLALTPDACGMRVDIRKSGCSGYRYVLEPVTTLPPQHHLLTLTSCQIFIAEQALSVIGGTQVELVKEGVNENIRFNNPNAGSVCGCGESFTVSD